MTLLGPTPISGIPLAKRCFQQRNAAVTTAAVSSDRCQKVGACELSVVSWD